MRLKPSVKWYKEADVVVVGYGAAGASAAITAHDAGARVLILEKAPEGEEGGNSRVSGQGWLTPAPVDRAIVYFNALCGEYTVPQDMVRAWAEEMGKNTDWVKGLGGNPTLKRKGPEQAEFPDLPGADCVFTYQLDDTLGEELLWKLLKASVDKRRIDVLCGTPAQELIEDAATGDIIGVRTGAGHNVKARRAVVLTCGGFENNQDMVRDYLSNLTHCYPVGTPYNTGDGIKMAMAVGADLWHMNNISGPWYYLKVPEFPAVMELVPQHHYNDYPGGMIMVAGDGKRFMNEKHKITHGKVRVGGEWVQAPTRRRMVMILDNVLFSSGPLHDNNLYHGWNSILNVYHWSDDNKAELAKGWIIGADTVAGLARKIGLDPVAVDGTVNRWNGFCAAGKDADFGRTKMLAPLDHAPFYAIEMTPAFSSTQGGPRRNARGQIVRPDGRAIGRLYSAGELGSIHSFLYQGAGNIGECLAFGRISGRNAAAEKPWE